MDEWHFEIVQGASTRAYTAYWPEWSRTVETLVTLEVRSILLTTRGPYVGRAMDIEGVWSTKYHSNVFQLRGVWPFGVKTKQHINENPLWLSGIPEARDQVFSLLETIGLDEWRVGLTRTIVCPLKHVVSMETWPQPEGAHRAVCRLYGHVSGATAALQASYRGDQPPRLGKSKSHRHGPNNPRAERWLRSAIQELDPQIRQNLHFYERNVPR